MEVTCEEAWVQPGKFHEAKVTNAPCVSVWGTGQARREFLHVADLADACVHVMRLGQDVYVTHTQPMLFHINIGTGTDVTIRALAELVREVVGFEGNIAFDPRKPDGALRKLLDVSRLRALGWQPCLAHREGLDAGPRSRIAWEADTQRRKP
jgi:GDP-L-fucose synthase